MLEKYMIILNCMLIYSVEEPHYSVCLYFLEGSSGLYLVHGPYVARVCSFY